MVQFQLGRYRRLMRARPHKTSPPGTVVAVLAFMIGGAAGCSKPAAPAPSPAAVDTRRDAHPQTGGAKMIARPLFERTPSAADIRRHAPAAAHGQGGEARLVCGYRGARLSCSVATEAPPNRGFGAAALSLAPYYQLSARQRTGAPAPDDAIVAFTVRFPAAPPA